MVDEKLMIRAQHRNGFHHDCHSTDGHHHHYLYNNSYHRNENNNGTEMASSNQTSSINYRQIYQKTIGFKHHPSSISIVSNELSRKSSNDFDWPNVIDCDNGSEDCGDFQYGPGIVNRLKNKFMALSSQNDHTDQWIVKQRCSSSIDMSTLLKRCASLEELTYQQFHSKSFNKCHHFQTTEVKQSYSSHQMINGTKRKVLHSLSNGQSNRNNFLSQQTNDPKYHYEIDSERKNAQKIDSLYPMNIVKNFVLNQNRKISKQQQQQQRQQQTQSERSNDDICSLSQMNPLPSTMAILSPVTLALATSKNEINDSDDGGDQHPHCLRYQKKQEHYRSLMDNDVDDDDSRGTIDDDDDGDDDDDDVDGDDDNKNGGYNGQKNILTIHNGNNGKCGKTNLLLLSTPKPYIKRSKSVETLSFLMQKEKLIFPIVTNNLNGDDDDDDDLVERTELESKTKTRKSDSKSDLILTDVKSIIKSIAIPERFQSSTVAVSVSIPKTNDFIQCNEPLNEDKSILNFSEDDNNYDDDDDGESGDKSDDSGVEIINDIHQKTILIASKTTKEETTIKLDCKQKTDIGVLNQTESKCLQSELISSILSHQNNETITSQHQSSSQSNRNLINNSKEIEMIATMRDVSKNSTDTKSSISLETTLNTSSVNIKTKSSIDSNHSRSSTSSLVALSLQNQKHHHHHHHNPNEPNLSELPKPDTVKTVKRLFEHCDQSVNQNLSLSSRKIQSSKTQQSVSSSSLTNHRQKNYPAPAPPLPPRQTQSSPTTSTTVSIVGQTKSITTTSIGRVLKKPTISSKPNSVIQQQQQHQRQQQQQQHQEKSNSLATITTNNHHSRSDKIKRTDLAQNDRSNHHKSFTTMIATMATAMTTTTTTTKMATAIGGQSLRPSKVSLQRKTNLLALKPALSSSSSSPTTVHENILSREAQKSNASIETKPLRKPSLKSSLSERIDENNIIEICCDSNNIKPATSVKQINKGNSEKCDDNLVDAIEDSINDIRSTSSNNIDEQQQSLVCEASVFGDDNSGENNNNNNNIVLPSSTTATTTTTTIVFKEISENNNGNVSSTIVKQNELELKRNQSDGIQNNDKPFPLTTFDVEEVTNRNECNFLAAIDADNNDLNDQIDHNDSRAPLSTTIASSLDSIQKDSDHFEIETNQIINNISKVNNNNNNNNDFSDCGNDSKQSDCSKSFPSPRILTSNDVDDVDDVDQNDRKHSNSIVDGFNSSKSSNLIQETQKQNEISDTSLTIKTLKPSVFQKLIKSTERNDGDSNMNTFNNDSIAKSTLWSSSSSSSSSPSSSLSSASSSSSSLSSRKISSSSSLSKNLIQNNNGSSSIVFDFRDNKTIKPNIAIQPAPFGAKPIPKRIIKEIVSQGPRTSGLDYDDENDGNHSETINEITSKNGVIQFQGENVIVGSGNLLQRRNKNLSISFNDSQPSLFEYPFEDDDDDCDDEGAGGDDENDDENDNDPKSKQFVNVDNDAKKNSNDNGDSNLIQSKNSNSIASIVNSIANTNNIISSSSSSSSSSSTAMCSSLKKNTFAIGSTNLGAYKPSIIERTSFELGITKTQRSDQSMLSRKRNDDKSNENSNDCENETITTMIKPANSQETFTFSQSSTASDLLF